jgi:hypothetical protein
VSGDGRQEDDYLVNAFKIWFEDKYVSENKFFPNDVC